MGKVIKFPRHRAPRAASGGPRGAVVEFPRERWGGVFAAPLFEVRIVDDSLAGIGIPKDAAVCVKRAVDFKDGDIICAGTPHGVHMGPAFREPGDIVRLDSANPNFRPLRYPRSRVIVFGVACSAVEMMEWPEYIGGAS